MRRLLQFAVLLLVAVPVHAAITDTGVGCAVAATTCTITGIQAGDYAYAFAFRSATTAPTLPSGWTQIATASASTSSFRSACAVATTTSITVGTWTNATDLVIEVYRGANATTTANCATVGTGIGGNANNSGTTSTVTYGAITMSDPSGGSWVIGASGDSAHTCLPAGMSTKQTVTGPVALLNDTNAGVTSWSSTNCTGTTGNWKSNVVEILALFVAVCTSPCVGTDSGVAGDGGSGVTSAVTATGVATTTGWMAVVLTECGAGVAPCTSISAPTDTAGNTYTLIGSQQNSSEAGIQLAYSANIAGNAANKVTCNFTSAQHDACLVIYLSGMATSSALDTSNSVGTCNPCSTLTGGAYTTTNARDVLVNGGSQYGGTGTGTVRSAAFNSVAANVAVETNATHGGAAMAYLSVSATQSATTDSMTWTSSIESLLNMAALKQSGGSPPACTPTMMLMGVGRCG